MEKYLQREQLEFVLHNVFLTRRLPLTADKTEFDGTLVRLMFNSLPSCEIPIPGMKSVQNTMQTWESVQSIGVNENQVLGALHGLQPGQTFAIFVRAQNSVITIRRSNFDTNNALMSVSRTSATNEKVMTAGDLLIAFPERAVWIPFHRLLSEPFACQVAALCNNIFDETLKETSKAGINHPDSRDVAEPYYVFSWLLGAMSGAIQAANDFEYVQKVIRDDVLSNKNSKSPWRRSGEWIAIKLVLHVMLITELGSDEGTVIYKSLMIHIMVHFLDNLPDSFDDNDIVMQIMSKISRRMAKLRNRINNSDENSNHCGLRTETRQWVSNLFQECRTVLIKVRNAAECRWKCYAQSCCELVDINISGLNAGLHKVHKMSEDALCRLNQAFQEEVETSIHIPTPSCAQRYDYVTAMFDIELLKSATQENQIEENLWDFEMWVRTVLWGGFRPNISLVVTRSDEIFNLFQKYLQMGSDFYKNDALGSSRMVLTLFLIFASLESIAIAEWSIISEYHSGFEQSLFNRLLVPLFDDMKYLHAVQTYFISRNISAIYPCIISKLCEDSVGPRIAADNPEMQQKRKEILEYAKQQRNSKIEEYTKLKQHYNELMTEYNSHSKYRTCCIIYCSKCVLLGIANSIKIEVYEDPIPEGCIWEQNVIVFELNIPTSIRCLRDALFLMQHKLCENQFYETKIKLAWKSYRQLRNWINFECHKSMVTIGSSAALYAVTCFRDIKVAEVWNNECFLKPCGLNIIPCYESSYRCYLKVTYQDARETVPNWFYTIRAWNEPYDIDEKWISGTSHTENEVLALQVKCPLNLDINEFKAFGSLRAGH